MPADLYRDPTLGLRARLVDLVARIRERLAEVTDDFWRTLDDAAEERLDAMHGAMERVAECEELSLDTMARAEADLTTGLDELVQLIARIPTVEEEWRSLPDEVDDPPAAPEPWPLALPTFEERTALEKSLVALVRDRDREATVERDGQRSWVARFRDRDAPFSLRATAYTGGNGVISEVAMCLVTSVPRAAPALFVQHESLLNAFGKVLGVRHEVEVGEPSFDGLFLIEGTQETAALVLPPKVRALLLALARFDVPTLEIDPPRREASIRWRFEPAPAALDAAVRVLASIREVDARVRLKK
jgi:hypothetical protein